MPKFDNAALKSYIDDFDFGKATEERFHAIVNDYLGIVGCDPDFVFVEDDINDDGNREFVTVVLLNTEIWAEGWIGKTKSFHLTRIKDRVLTIVFEERLRMSGDVTNSRSKISVHIGLTDGGYASFGATGKNCDQVMAAVRDYFLPNLVSRSGFAVDRQLEANRTRAKRSRIDRSV